MEKKKGNEELQSRREFFKKAAKGALPILGAIVLASAPAIINAAGKEPMGCKYGCTTGCYTACSGGCKFTCDGTCKGACEGCKYTCNNTCKNTCLGTCKHSSER